MLNKTSELKTNCDKCLISLFITENDTNFWIGAEKASTVSSVFTWPGGLDVAYDHWVSRVFVQPDRGDEDCVFLSYRDRYFWHDTRCDERLQGYICEIWNISSGASKGKSVLCLPIKKVRVLRINTISLII